MKVLITGGTGTISSGLVKGSVKRGYDTFAITRGNNNSRNIEGANYIHGDIWNSNEIGFLLNEMKFDVVVECLAYNVEQLKISLENFSSKCQQYVFISTAAIYNRQGEKRIVEADEKSFTEWNYTREKIECEKYLKDYSEKNGLKYTIVRPTVTYGDFRIPFPIATRSPGWTFFQRMLDGKPMLASDNVKFSVIHIDDFSKAVVGLFGNEKAYNEDFHITDKKNDIYWDDVIKLAGKVLGVNPKIIHVNQDVIKKAYPSIYYEIAYHKNTTQLFDDTKLKTAVEFEASISIEDGIQRIIASMKNEFESRGLSLDEEWNDLCNATILEAFREKKLNQDEELLVLPFVDEYKISAARIKRERFTSIPFKFVRKIKEVIKRIIK